MFHVVKQGIKKSKFYGFRAISGGIGFLEHLAKRDIIAKKLYATSRTLEGRRICQDMGFKQITPPREEDNLIRFELDLQTTTNPLFKNYQSIVEQSKERLNY